MSKALIIAICNQKGGCAKTTTAIETGACLAASGARVLLIDKDHQGNLTEAMGFVEEEAAGTYELLMGRAGLEEVVRQSSIENLYFVPATIDLSAAESELMGLIGREQQLRHALSGSLDKYDYIILDNPPSLGVIVINSLAAADYVIIPVQVFRFARKGLDRIITFFDLVQKRLNPDLKDWMVLPTMVDYRRRDEEKVNRLREQLGAKVFKNQIHVNSSVIESQEAGKPLVLFDKHGVGAKQYRSFALEMAEWIKAGNSVG